LGDSAVAGVFIIHPLFVGFWRIGNGPRTRHFFIGLIERQDIMLVSASRALEYVDQLTDDSMFDPRHTHGAVDVLPTVVVQRKRTPLGLRPFAKRGAPGIGMMGDLGLRAAPGAAKNQQISCELWIKSGLDLRTVVWALHGMKIPIGVNQHFDLTAAKRRHYYLIAGVLGGVTRRVEEVAFRCHLGARRLGPDFQN
jgi:hypothetical protein